MRFKILFTVLLCFAFVVNVFSQSAFKFKYHFTNVGDTTTYKAFLVDYGDETGFIRVKYMDARTNTPVLVDMEMEEHYPKKSDGTLDTTKFYFQGTKPIYILGDSTEEYYPEVFWFKINPQTDLYEPWGVTATDGKIVAQGEFISADLLQEKDLTKDLILEFFTKNDDLYKNLFETTSRGLTPSEKSGTKINLLIVANTEDESIGKSCVTDKERALKTYTNLANFLGIGITTKVVSDKDYSKANVEKALNELRPGSNDIVIFYYSGHGFSKAMDEQHKYPYLDLRSDPHAQNWDEYGINIEDIFNTIKNKGARLNLVLSDCCNNDPNATNNMGVSIARTRGSGLTWSVDNCKSLFLNPKPISILMTAADKGQEASGTNDDGGFFSYYFKMAMEDFFSQFKKNVSWDEVLEDAKNQTTTKVQATCTSGNVCEQNPFFKVQYKN